MHNACIVSFFMDNINPKTVSLQSDVVQKFNKSKYPHYTIKTNMRHGASIDYFWCLNGSPVHTMNEANVKQSINHDIVLILDIDCIPLNETAIDHFIEVASSGNIIGNAQRSGHIENDQHVFAAPSATAISKTSFEKIGMPSALETAWGDVLEEYTYAAEKADISLDLLLPTKYDIPPRRMNWETNQEPFWRLADGMPNYGIGTTYGSSDVDMFYHNFQIFHPGNQERFWHKCEEVLNG